MPPLRKPYSAGLPDFNYINGLPIVDVARKIGLEFSDDRNMVCPRSDRHKDGSAALLRLLPENKVKCDACKTGPLSVVDLLMHVGGFDSPRIAALCFASDLDVPTIARGSHLNNPDCQVVPPTCEDPIGLLILTGVWSALPEPVKSLMPVLLKLAKWSDSDNEPTLHISYGAMMTYSGMSSPNVISKALTEMARIGWLERLESPPRGDSSVKPAASYRLTPLSDRVMDRANATAPLFGAKILTQKAARKVKRQAREALLESRRQPLG